MGRMFKILIITAIWIGGTMSYAWENKNWSKENLDKKLTKIQYKVTQKEGTEPPYKNEFWDNKKDGIYVDIVSGEPLFSSKDKYDSKSGWPSFTKPLVRGNIVEKKDRRLFRVRTEVKSKHADGHLGHVFPDGPGANGLRYCINSASLRFVPKEDLEKEGYQEFVSLFSKKKTMTFETAILAGGCFWGMEQLIRELPGVLDTAVGYSGGKVDSPTYGDVSVGSSGHAEAIKIKYDPSKITYGEILDFFFRIHDPTTINRQGNDKGTQYRSAIFYQDEKQKKVALLKKDETEAGSRWKNPVVTEISKATEFYDAEEYHQDYLVKNRGGYTCHFIRD